MTVATLIAPPLLKVVLEPEMGPGDRAVRPAVPAEGAVHGGADGDG